MSRGLSFYSSAIFAGSITTWYATWSNSRLGLLVVATLGGLISGAVWGVWEGRLTWEQRVATRPADRAIIGVCVGIYLIRVGLPAADMFSLPLFGETSYPPIARLRAVPVEGLLGSIAGGAGALLGVVTGLLLSSSTSTEVDREDLGERRIDRAVENIRELGGMKTVLLKSRVSTLIQIGRILSEEQRTEVGSHDERNRDWSDDPETSSRADDRPNDESENGGGEDDHDRASEADDSAGVTEGSTSSGTRSADTASSPASDTTVFADDPVADLPEIVDTAREHAFAGNRQTASDRLDRAIDLVETDLSTGDHESDSERTAAVVETLETARRTVDRDTSIQERRSALARAHAVSEFAVAEHQTREAVRLARTARDGEGHDQMVQALTALGHARRQVEELVPADVPLDGASGRIDELEATLREELDRTETARDRAEE